MTVKQYRRGAAVECQARYCQSIPPISKHHSAAVNEL